MVKVCYTDGNTETFGSVKEAESAIYETMVFSDFEKIVDGVYQEVDGKRKPLWPVWSLKLSNT